MSLPALVSGKRFTLPQPLSAADALLLAQLAQREKAAGKLTVIVTADANVARRLKDEVTLLDPDVRCARFRSWETMPYDTC